ncbi:MAG: SpoVA/SpoVAEb family sporulation membrane protein [Dethiobacter sp.]
MLVGHQSWLFRNTPVILASAAVGGPFEANSALAEDFDILHDDIWMGQDSLEKAEKKLLEEACEKVIIKAKLKKEDIQFFFSGDLTNQIVTSSFAARTLGIPYFGLFGACSSSMEGLALSAFIVNAGGARYVMAAAASHNGAVNKQYRYPTEYGAQLPPTAHTTVTMVVAGSVLGGLGLYEPLIKFAGAGATIPISSFGNALVSGALAEAKNSGMIGVFTGIFEVTSAGISSAIIFGFLASLIFKPKG